VPAEADAYEIAAPEGAPELDASAVGQWKGVFHRLGLTPDQVKGLTSEFFGSPMGNPAMAGEAMQAHTVQLLRNEWGGSYDHNLKMASVGARTVLGPEFVALMEQTGFGNHPVILKACLRLGKDRREAGMMPTDAKTGGILGPEDAQTRITELMQTPEYRRGDRATVDEVQRLFQLKHS